MITSGKTNLLILCITLVLHVGCQEKEEGHTSRTQKPNILIIQVNDLGYEEIAFYHKNGIAFNNLDRLGRESVRFQRFYVAALGAPTQASLLTGRHYLRTGVSHNYGGRNFLSLQEKTIAKFFKESGYTTGMWGLWQLGDSPGYYPWHRGFDNAFITRQKFNDKGTHYNGESINKNSATDEVITDYALRFIENASNRPFFAYIAYVNAPDIPENRLLDITREKDIPKSVAKRYAAIENCDTQIGRLLSALNQLQLDDNTMVIFMSNNDPTKNRPLLPRQNSRSSEEKRLKDTKGTLAENGIRSPFYIRYKNIFTSGKNQVLADVSDLFPTLCDIAGISIAENSVLLDGKTLIPVLKKESNRRNDKLVFNYTEPSWQFTHDSTRLLQTYKAVLQSDTSALKFSKQTLSIHNQDYKLVLNPLIIDHSIPLVNGYALFNIAGDSAETTNLINDKPEITTYLKNELRHWFDGILKSRNAFQIPRFPIGYIGKIQNPFPACAARRTSDEIKRTPFFLGNWNNEKDFAEFSLDIHTPGRYKIILKHQSKKASQATVDITLQNQIVSGRIANRNRVELLYVQLRTGESTLKLKVSNLPDKKTPAFDKLVAIELIRM